MFSSKKRLKYYLFSMIEEIIFLNYYMERLQLELWYRQIFPVQECFQKAKDGKKKVYKLRVFRVHSKSTAKLNLNIKRPCPGAVEFAEEDGLPGS
jgi:hypothetical protein